MAILDEIRKEAKGNNTKIQSSEEQQLEGILNKMFYLPKVIEQETEFVRYVMTRGAETEERIGLHASSILVSDKEFCLRSQVLSLIYKQNQGEQYNPSLLRIFEEGNAIHEKWQRMFLRAGYSKVRHLDRTLYASNYKMYYTADIVCKIPEFSSERMVGEIKSVNTFQFQKMVKHPSAWKQCQWYMHLLNIRKGFILCEDKNTQDFKLEIYDYDPDLVKPYIDRANNIVYSYNKLINNKVIPKRPATKEHESPESKRCKTCHMKDACWNIGIGRVKL